MKTSKKLKVNSLIVFSFIFLTYLGECEAQDSTWPQFRGHNSSGHADESAKPPVQFGPNQNVLWKVELPEGHSSPCIWGDNIFLTGFIKDKNELQTICVNRSTGKVNWRQSIYPEKIEYFHAISNAAVATPTTDGERVYVYFGSYGLLCYDMNGVLVWEKQIPIVGNWFGASSSPIATKDALILCHDFQDNSYLLALNKATGDSVWKVLLPKVNSSYPNNSSYSTPLVMNNQLILHRVWEISGYSLKDGSRLWGLPTPTSGVSTPVFNENTIYAGTWQEFGEKDRVGIWPEFVEMLKENDANGDSLIEQNEIPKEMLLFSRPGMDENTWYIYKIFGMMDIDENGLVDEAEWTKQMNWAKSLHEESGLLAFEPSGNGELSSSLIKWKISEKVPEVPSPIYCKGYVYMIKNGGIITCVDSESGEIIYREKLGVSGPYLASPVVANDNMYIPSNNGVITVIEAGNQLNILAKNDLEEKIYASPAVIGNILYVRTEKHLFAFGR